MNREEIIARPYEEYYEMIKDMSKDNMIQGLYDLSKNCIEYQNYINQLEEENKQLKANRDEALEYIKEKELKDIKGNTLYCEGNLIWHELALILDKTGGCND